MSKGICYKHLLVDEVFESFLVGIWRSAGNAPGLFFCFGDEGGFGAVFNTFVEVVFLEVVDDAQVVDLLSFVS